MQKHKGIVFTDKNGNVIDDNSPCEDDEHNRPEITGVSTGEGSTHNTGAPNNNSTETSDMRGAEITNALDSTGVDTSYTHSENTPDLQDVHTTQRYINKIDH